MLSPKNQNFIWVLCKIPVSLLASDCFGIKISYDFIYKLIELSRLFFGFLNFQCLYKSLPHIIDFSFYGFFFLSLLNSLYLSSATLHSFWIMILQALFFFLISLYSSSNHGLVFPFCIFGIVFWMH